MIWIIGYMALGVLSNFLTVRTWRKDSDWNHDWSDWLFIGFFPGLVLWPFCLPYEIGSRVKTWKETRDGTIQGPAS